MSRADTWMPLYVADYLRDTTHLSAEEHGGYLLLLMGCWTRGGTLPKEDAKLAAIARMTPAAWKRSRATIMEFFIQDGDGWTHRRVAAELKRAADLSEKRRQAGAKGGEAKAQSAGRELANARQEVEQKPTPTRVAPPSPSPSPEGEKDADASSVGSAEPMPTASAAEADLLGELTTGATKPKPWQRDQAFLDAWAAVPKLMHTRSESREKTWPIWAKAAVKAGGPDRLLAAVKAYVAGDPDLTRPGSTAGAGFHRWLAAGRWEHWLTVADAARPAVTWTGPADLRAAAAAVKGVDWCVSYLDRCGWHDVPQRTLVSPSTFATRVIAAELGDLLARSNITLEERRAA